MVPNEVNAYFVLQAFYNREKHQRGFTNTHGHLSPAPHSRPVCVFWVHKASSIAATVAQFEKSSQKSADDQMKLDVWRTLEVNLNSESRISQILIYQL